MQPLQMVFVSTQIFSSGGITPQTTIFSGDQNLVISLKFNLIYLAYSTTQVIVNYPLGVIITGVPTLSISQAVNSTILSWNSTTIVFNTNFNKFLTPATQLTLNISGPSQAPRSALTRLQFSLSLGTSVGVIL